MAAQGVFRDTFYNAMNVLTEAQANTGPSATGVIAATLLAGACECNLSLGGTSQTFTTDTAVNIIAQLQTAVAAAIKANVGGFAAALSDQPPQGVPNLFNASWIINISGTGITTGATLAGGAGVTLSNIGTLSPSALAVGAGTVSTYVAQVTGPASITLTRVA